MITCSENKEHINLTQNQVTLYLVVITSLWYIVVMWYSMISCLNDESIDEVPKIDDKDPEF